MVQLADPLASTVLVSGVLKARSAGSATLDEMVSDGESMSVAVTVTVVIGSEYWPEALEALSVRTGASLTAVTVTLTVPVSHLESRTPLVVPLSHTVYSKSAGPL